jgi:MFS family permease
MTTFQALKVQSFRKYYFGQLISTIGIWMQNIAQGYLVYSITKSTLALGLVACASGLPMLIISPFAGVLIERYKKKNILIIVQIIQLFQAVTMAWLTATETIQLSHIIVLAFLFGVTYAVDFPCRQALISEVVGKENLESGISLNSLLTNIARAAGPAFAGFVLALVGPAWCFMLNGLSFLAVIVSLIGISVPYAAKIDSSKRPHIRDIADGFNYIKQNPLVISLLLLTSNIGMFVVSLIQLYPSFAALSLNSPIEGYSAINVGNGVGAVIAGLIVSRLVKNIGRVRLIVGVLILTAFSNILLAMQINIAAATIFSTLAGLFTVVGLICLNTTIQTSISNEYRGRVMSLYSLAYFGLTPFAVLLMGTLATTLGTSSVVFFAAALSGFVTLIILWKFPMLMKKEQIDLVQITKSHQDQLNPITNPSKKLPLLH